MKKTRPRAVTVALVLLLLAGVCVMLYPTASDWYAKWQMQREISQYNQVSEISTVDYSQLWAEAEAYNRTLPGKADQLMVSEVEEQQVRRLLNPLGTGMMGYIDIPKIDVHLPVFQGIEETQLQSGAGWWIGSSLPTGGPSTHCIITAHTGLVKAKMFTDVDQLVEGDRFTLSILDRELTYEVDQILVTLPEDSEPLKIVEGEDYVTLYTCTPYGVNTHRLLVRGRRVEDSEAAEGPAEAQPGWRQLLEKLSSFYWIIGALLALLILIRLAEGIRRRRARAARRRRRAKRKKRGRNARA